MNIPNVLLNDHYDDRYFDVVDALAEAKRIHIGNARIIERINTNKNSVNNAVNNTDTNIKGIKIGELGFGPGRLLLALMDSLDDAIAVGPVIVDYNTVEMYPLSPERMEGILGVFGDRGGRVVRNIRRLVDAYSRMGIDIGVGADAAKHGWYTGVISGDNWVVNLNLYVGEAMGMVESLGAPCAAWFLDGHAPKKNPDMWRPKLLSAVGRKTELGGTATAFTVAGHVRRSLAAAGFSVEKVAGCGGKKEALLGTLHKNIDFFLP